MGQGRRVHWGARLSCVHAVWVPVRNARPVLVILAVGALLRLVCWLPYYQGVDFYGTYAPAAQQLLTGAYRPGLTYVYNAFASMRLGVIIPAALSIKLFGYSIPAQALYPLLCSLLTLVVIYRIGLRLEVRIPNAASIACGFGSMYPLLVTQAPLLLPDTPRALFSTAAILFLIRAHERGYGAANMVWCGLMMGMSYLCQIGVLFMIPGLLVWLIWRREIRANHAWILIGFLAVLVLETSYLSLNAGKVVTKLGALVQSAQDPYIGNHIRTTYPGVSRYLPGYFEAFLSPTTPYFVLHGLAGWLAMVAVLWAVRQKDGILSLMVACWLSDCLVLNFGPMPGIETRYLLAGIPLLSIVVGALLGSMAGSRARLAVVALVVLSSLAGCLLSRLAYTATNDACRTVVAWYDKYPYLNEREVFVTESISSVVRYTQGFTAKLASFDLPNPTAEMPVNAVCFFNGYHSFGDVPAAVRRSRLTQIESAQLGYPAMAGLFGRLTPKIGFDGQVALLRIDPDTGGEVPAWGPQ